MKQDPTLPLSAVSLRERAIHRLSGQSIPDVTQMSVVELQRWSYELLIEKAELELRNEDLQEALHRTEEKRAESPCPQNCAQGFTDSTVLQQDRERLHFQAQILGAVGEAVIATDLAGTITYFNRAAEELYGWSAQAVIGRNCVDALTNEATAEQSAAIMSQLARGESWSGEFVVRRRDHSTFLAMVRDSPILNVAGEMIGIKGISQDISSQKRTEAALQTTRDLMERAFHAISDGLVIQGPDGRILQCNTAAAQILGLTGDQIAGRCALDPHWQAVHPNGSPFLDKDHPAIVTQQTGQPVRGVVMGIKKPNGSQTWIKINSTVGCRDGLSHAGQ